MSTSFQHSTQLANIARQYLPLFKQNNSVTGNQWSALNAIIGCRTPQYGQVYLACKSASPIPVRINRAAIEVAIAVKTTVQRNGSIDKSKSYYPSINLHYKENGNLHAAFRIKSSRER